MNKNKKLKSMFTKTGVSVALCIAMMSAVPVQAAQKAEYTKDENIYGILKDNGNVDSLYVVNQFDVSRAGTITDYGKFDSVQNLTDTSKILSENSTQSLEAKEGMYYYQGNLKNGILPWEIEINYSLNGKKIAAEKLAGANGETVISIKTSENKNNNHVFYKNYMLQISITIDNKKAVIKDASDATIADAGSGKKINYTVMPGKEADIVLKLEVTDFEMAGISISAIPFSMATELPDTEKMSSGLYDLAKGIGKLNSGVGEIDTGTQKLNQGMQTYTSGLNQYINGIETADKNFPALINGMKKITKGSKSLKTGMDLLSKNGTDIVSGSANFQTAISDYSDNISQMDLSGLSPENAAYIKQVAQALDKNYEKFQSGLSEYVGGIQKIDAGYDTFHSGLTSYSKGVAKFGTGMNRLADNGKKLNLGAQKLGSGMEQIAGGIEKLHGGTAKMAEKTADIPDKMQKEIDKMMDSYNCDFKMVSFNSDKNKHINHVQFMITTPDIKKEKKALVEQQEKKESFIDRCKALFSN